jgi:hypothetical protein
MAKNFRSLFRWLLPSWLKEDEGGLVAYSLAVVKDIYMERVRQGIAARFPRYAQDDALQIIGAERGLFRGRSTHDRYVERLQGWRQAHARRGSAFAVLGQISAYFGDGVNLRTIDTKGTEHTIDAAGATAYAYGQTWGWATTGARFWVEMLDPSTDLEIDANTYAASGSYWVSTTGETVGMQGTTPYEMQDIRDLFLAHPKWKPAGTRAEWFLINTSAGASYIPDATWEDWSKIVSYSGSTYQQPSRETHLRFVSLRLRTYEGANQWSDYVPFLGSTGFNDVTAALSQFFAGTASSATAWDDPDLSAFGGDASYLPDATTWVDGAKLPDDGDIPQ